MQRNLLTAWACDFQLQGSDVEGTPLTFVLLVPPTHGTLGVPPGALMTNALTYTPAPNYHGPDQFTFKVSDGTNESAPAMVSISVISVNDAPLVESGADQIISLPTDTVELTGMVADDYFIGALLTVQWTKVSGPGVVTFASSHRIQLD